VVSARYPWDLGLIDMSETDVLADTTPENLPLFSELGLLESIVQAVEEKGYTHPTPIQARAIPILLSGGDIIGGSQTGTGKTAAFALPILSMLEKHDGKKGTRALILEPTRELALQVFEQLEMYGKHLDLNVALLYGGVKYGKQKDALAAGADIIVATPGRLLDHIGQRTVNLKHLEILVLDEADRMLDMGFLPDVTKILDRCPSKRQSLLFSATIPSAIERLSKRMLKDPTQIKIGGGRQPAETISHAIYPVDERQKFDLLVAILKHVDYQSVLIFSRTKMGADTIARWLDNTGHGPVGVLHADRTQREREMTLKAFRDGSCQIMVATDIVARGIDISGVSHVINYDIPQHAEDYVHRIGRTGRAKQEGDAVTIYTAGEIDFLRAIERFIGREIERKKLEGFDYAWSPVLDEGKPKKKKRNRGFTNSPTRRFPR